MSKARLVLEDIAHRYESGGFELDVERLAVAPGDVVGIIGPNGAGKSTLLRIAAGVIEADDGRVLLDGRPLASMERREVARSLGYLPQETVAQFDYTVAELAAMGRYPHHRGFAGLNRADREIVERSIRQTEMQALAGRTLAHLSGGERKRAFLASVLAQEPGILLLDEPTGALDIHHQVHFFRLLVQLAGRGMAVAVVTHEVNLASLFSDRIVLMHQGRIAAEGAPREVLTEEAVHQLYGRGILLHRHPESGLPIVLPAAEPYVGGGAP